MQLFLKAVSFGLLAAQQVAAHTGLSNFYVNGVDQGDAVCVRMNPSPNLWSDPVNDLSSSDMACGFNGTVGVNRVCPVPDGATLTFEWREIADQPGAGVIDISHMGPCSVYMKKVDSAIKDTAAGDGWFKIWDEGYDEATDQWCTLKLINNGGFLSVDIPKGLVGGNYLVRPELLALHEVEDDNNPQYYVGCAQIFLQSTGNQVAVSTVEIPGQVHLGDPADSYNIYTQPLVLPYPLPGPPVTTFKSGSAGGQTQQTEGLKPPGCICESGSNFCGVEVPDYSDEAGCYTSSQNCWNQLTDCYNTAPPTGNAECHLFENKCNDIQAQCPNASTGPPNKGQDLSASQTTLSPIPAPLGPTVISGSSTVQGAAPTVHSGAQAYSSHQAGAVNSSPSAHTSAPSSTTTAVGQYVAQDTGSGDSSHCKQVSCPSKFTTTTTIVHTVVAQTQPTSTRKLKHGKYRQHPQTYRA